MKISKKVKCLHCNSVIENNGRCECQAIFMVEGTVTEGALGKDYLDVSAVLLNESV